ncbi:MDR family MFS transporter [Dyella jiangningensis]|uniref:MFS transporter n=1 Tax=Dyella jiangningensis TaxID=1379159 RepID=A0A328PC98_9GAMM|nr:MDR family MFS transporter [Dyella jiangningensis]RAO77865.1 MFS transporter [Dyella jiangningensis]
MTSPHTDTTIAPTEREIRQVFIGLIIMLALGAIDQSIVATALPRIVSDLGGINHLSWVVTAYVLASTATMPLYGKLSDQYGRKPMVYVAVITFLLGSVLSGASRNLVELIVFRAVQGLGAGGLVPLAQIIIGDMLTPTRRGRWQGVIAAIFAICSVLGPLLGGVITDLLSWHWIFYINLPVGAVAMVMIGRALRQYTPLHARRIDYIGSVLMTVATVAFLLVLTLGGSTWSWFSTPLTGMALLALVCGVLFVHHVQHEPEPVLPLGLFHNRLFVIASSVMALTFMGLMGASLFFPLFFQLVMGASPARSGLLIGPLMMGMAASSLFNGRVLLRAGRYKPAQITGLAAATLAFAVLTWGAATSQSLVVIEPAILALGLGLGLVMPNMTIAVQNALAPIHRGVGTATLAFFRSLGGLVGVAGSGAILTWQLRAQGGAPGVMPLPGEGTAATLSNAASLAAPLYRHAIATTFLVGTCVIACAFLLILLMPEHPLRDHHHAPATAAD